MSAGSIPRALREPAPDRVPPQKRMIDLITPQSIIANMRAGSKKQALQELAKKAAELTVNFF